MIQIFIAIHIIVGVSLILIVMVQGSKSEGLSGLFGGGGSGTLFGTSAPTFLTKVTTVLGIMFMITSISLTVVFSKQSSSVMQKSVMEQQESTAEGIAEEQSLPQEKEPAPWAGE